METFEIFNLDLAAQMVVLGACETGVGDIIRGEGIMSLARGFAYAGCPSLVSSLWRVDDKATGILMALFYENLAAGQPKDVALRNAKLAFFEQPDIPWQGFHPALWGAFVHIGNPAPLQLPVALKPIPWYWVLVLVAMLAIGVWGTVRWEPS